ncbi:glycosyltransferase [uncultured Draconibacterium sp.]|uniref:glycosyltransferase n=1 Tax=uncultured Draconibacterium sp. TaxID=1573823 RepID=UPI0029C6E6EC|nr:glycosyltransferase [uncultured Draconibacterium sp.]
MTKIAEIIRFYSLDEIMDFIDKGEEYPRHHIWCYDKLKEDELQAECIDYNKNSKWNKIGQKLKVLNLQQQIEFLKRSDEFDVVFAPFVGDVFLLALLKSFGLYNKPVVAVALEAFTPYKKNYFKRLRQKMLRSIYVNGIDSLLFINEITYQHCNDYKKLKAVHQFTNTWGADLDFFDAYIKRQQEPPAQNYVYATGGTGRDYNTLFQAFKNIDYRLRITTKGDLAKHILNNKTDNIEIDDTVTPGLYSVGLIRQEYYNALAVAIPLKKSITHFPIGLTVLFEALAMSKPVISSHNKAYPFDLEKEKVGFNIDFEDVQGWEDCVNYLIENPDEAREMGERGKYLCEKKYNYKLFSNDVAKLVKRYGFTSDILTAQNAEAPTLR